MKYNRILSLLTVIIYGVFVVGSAILAFSLLVSISSIDTGDGFANGFLVLVGVIAIIVFIGYALIGITPFILKIVHFSKNAEIRALPAICLVFDTLYIAFNAILLISGLSEEETVIEVIVLWSLLLLLSVTAFVCNIFNVAHKNRNTAPLPVEFQPPFSPNT